MDSKNDENPTPRNEHEIEMEKIKEELQICKRILKKTRKEKESISKKLKRVSDEAKTENKNLLERLSDTSASDESLQIISPNPVEYIDEIHTNSAINKLEHRIVELQRSSDSLQKRYEDVCQKLETSEKSLEVQQELNARISSLSAETRQKHTFEIAGLQEVIEKLEDSATQTEEELLRVKELERTKTDVLVNLLEDEKQKIRDECDSLKNQLENAQKTLKEQKAESKRHLESEIWKLKKSVKAAERRKLETLDLSKNEGDGEIENPKNTEAGEYENLMAELAMLRTCLQISRSEDQTSISEIERKLTLEAEAANVLRDQVKALDAEILKLSSNQELKDEGVEELARMIDQKDKELRAEREKFKSLQQELEASLENADESIYRLRNLDEKESKLEAMRIEFEAVSTELTTHLTNVEKEKSSLQSQLDDLNNCLVQKKIDFEKLQEEKSNLQNEVELIKKKLEETLSPRKDKVTQLESRLEVIQVAAKAQQKRLEEDLIVTRAILDETSKENEDLQRQVAVLQEKSQLADDLTLSLNDRSSKDRANEEAIIELRAKVSQLEQEKEVLRVENAEERAGLVDELIINKEKLKECSDLASMQTVNLEKIKSLEEQLKNTKIELDKSQNLDIATLNAMQTSIDEKFPDLDPALRQIVHLILQNQNYMYGALGFVIYAFLIHLYILL